jgi:DNA-binding HxlR family transcriptional regulator
MVQPAKDGSMTTKTAAARRAEAKVSYDAYLKECPTLAVMDTITSKWVRLVLITLADGTCRYSHIAGNIAGVSPKMLTRTLRTLEADGLVCREVTPGVPIQVDYTLTELGNSLVPLILNIKTWADSHIDIIRESRRRAMQSAGTDDPGRH